MISDPRQIAIIGDTHGNKKFTLEAIDYCKNHGADTIVQLGDFGFWRNSDFLKGVNKKLNRTNIDLYWIDGNHEDHHWLNSLGLAEDGTRPMPLNKNRIHHLPRGFRWNWSGKTWMSLGGAVSIDQEYRKSGIDWFPEETWSYEDFNKALLPGVVDVIVSHDVPDKVDLPGGIDPGRISKKALKLSRDHRELLGQVCDEFNPKSWFHGHHHVRYDAFRKNKSGKLTFVHGLGKDNQSFTDSIVFIVPA